jgi:hypothetical protein
MFAPRLAAVLALVLALPAGVRAADVDAFLPADTESYLSVNVRQLLDSAFVKKAALGAMRDALKESQEASDVLKELGFDPFKDLDRLTIAGPSSAENDRGLIIAHGKFDVKKFEARAADAAQNDGDVLKIHKVPLGGGAMHEVYEVIIPGQDNSLFVALAGGKTLLASPGKDYVVDALKQARLKKKPALKSKAFQALLEKMDDSQTVSLAVPGKKLIGAGGKSDLLPKGARDALAKIEAVGGGLTVGTQDIKLELSISSNDETSAQTVRQTIDKAIKLGLVGLALLGDEQKEINLLLEVLKTIKVTGKAKVVTLSAALTADVLDDFFKKDG